MNKAQNRKRYIPLAFSQNFSNMKLKLLLFVLGLIHIATSVAGQKASFTLEMNNTSVLEVLTKIENQSDYSFAYSSELIDLDRQVDLKIDDKDINETLDGLFKGTDIEYIINGRQIMLYPKVTSKGYPKKSTGHSSSMSLAPQDPGLEVSGRVLDEAGETLPGATVLIKGTTEGTITDFNGEFTLPNVPEDATLQISFIGMKSIEIPVEGKTFFEVVLEEQSTDLDEIIVMGYGTKKKRDVIGSVSTLESEDIVDRATSNFEVALQGMASGVSVQSVNGVPGAPTRIRIRGLSSINSSVDPLWIIDGMPVFSSPGGIAGNDGVTTNQSPMSLINPNDIESIQVLKDAAATAIYGSRASNGVIIVTTKSGKKGIKSLNFDFSTGVSDLTRTPEDVGYVTNTSEWFSVMDEAHQYSYGRDFNVTSDYFALNTRAFDEISREQAEAINTNWYDQIFRRGSFTNVNLSTMGGSDNGNYYTSFNYRNDEGVQRHNSLERITGTTNVTVKPLKDLSIGAKINLSYTKNNRLPNANSRNNDAVAEGGINFLTLSALPWLPIYNPENPANYFNPYGGANGVATSDPNNYHNLLEQYRVLGGVNFEYKVPFVKGLSLRSEISGDIYQSNNTNWVSSAIYLDPGANITSYGAEEAVTFKSVNYNMYGTYSMDFNNQHFLDFVGGVESTRALTKRKWMAGDGLIGEFMELGTPNRFLGMNGRVGGESYLSAFFGRLNYKFGDKYLAGVSLRRDGSSNFTKENRWGTFAAFSAGWIISDEDFMSFLGNKIFLKLRGSYGETGNQNVLRGLNVVNYSRSFVYGGPTIGGVNGVLPTNIPVLDLTWEKTRSSDIGLDYGFLNDRINGSVAAYRRYVSDMILPFSIPSSAGLTNPNHSWPTVQYFPYNQITANIGDMVNSGIEFDINAVVIEKPFKWKTNFNISFNRNTIEKLSPVADASGSGLQRGTTISIVGHRRLQWFLADYAGVDPNTGLPMIYELDQAHFEETGDTRRLILEDGAESMIVATDDAIRNNRFIQYNKSQDPTYYGGWENTFQYKGFDLSILFSFSGGNYIFDYDETQALELNSGRLFRREVYENAWRQPGDITDYPRIAVNGRREVDGIIQQNFQRTTTGGWYNRSLHRGDFIRFRNLQLGYNFPSTVLDKIKVQSFRVYVSATNLMTFTDYPGFDPEGATEVYTAPIPQTRTITAGLKLGI